MLIAAFYATNAILIVLSAWLYRTLNNTYHRMQQTDSKLAHSVLSLKLKETKSPIIAGTILSSLSLQLSAVFIPTMQPQSITYLIVGNVIVLLLCWVHALFDSIKYLKQARNTLKAPYYNHLRYD